MRAKEQKLVITFHTTAEAIAMEKAFKCSEIPGRLIPVPRCISSDCGLSWCAPLEWRGRIQSYIEREGICFESMGEYLV